MQLKNILVKYWGYSSFRPMQEEIIQSVLDGHDTLALLPTGGGKSICFQVPGIALEGICIVVTPLIALMNDQVENLKKKQINAVAVHSGMHRYQIELAFENCMFGDVKFLYISPERLETEKLKAVLRRMKVNLLAVDEAHCISQWGYDFRPPYLRIADIRQLLPDVPVLALTATATAGVVTDIQEKLGFKTENIFRKSFVRKNLVYAVLREEDKMNRLLRLCNRVMGSGIVYVRSRKRTREISDFLLHNKIVADYYHAGLETSERNRKQSAWISGKIRIMVCTNAFGMGIDKPNVRLVVHMDLPDSLEAYFQEAGRAGRDEHKSWAVLLFDQSDITELKDNLANSYPPPDQVRNVYQAIGNYYQLPAGSGKGQSFDFDLHEFCRQYHFQQVVAFNALKILEKEGYIILDDSTDNPSLLHFKSKREDLYRFQVGNKEYDQFIKLILRSYTGVFTTFVKISEADLARRSEMQLDKVITMLSFLQTNGLLVYVPRRNKPQIVFATQRFDTKNIYFTDQHYFDRYKASAQRIDSVIDYVTRTDRCRSQMLLDYFSETQSVRCGECDICRERNKMDMSDLELTVIVEKVESLLIKQPLAIEEVISQTPGHNEDKVIKAIQWLLDNGRISAESENLFRLNIPGNQAS